MKTLLKVICCIFLIAGLGSGRKTNYPGTIKEDIGIEYLGIAKGKKYIRNYNSYKSTTLEPNRLNRIVIQIP